MLAQPKSRVRCRIDYPAALADRSALATGTHLVAGVAQRAIGRIVIPVRAPFMSTTSLLFRPGRQTGRIPGPRGAHDVPASLLPAARAALALADLRAQRFRCASRKCSARCARSAGSSVPSGSTSRSNLAIRPRRPGSVRAVRSGVLAQLVCAASDARRVRCSGFNLDMWGLFLVGKANAAYRPYLRARRALCACGCCL